jgi:hypothetical protein
MHMQRPEILSILIDPLPTPRLMACLSVNMAGWPIGCEVVTAYMSLLLDAFLLVRLVYSDWMRMTGRCQEKTEIQGCQLQLQIS